MALVVVLEASAVGRETDELLSVDVEARLEGAEGRVGDIVGVTRVTYRKIVGNS